MMMFHARVTPADKVNIDKLINLGSEKYSDFGKPQNLVFEFIPGKGLNIYYDEDVPDSMDYRMRLTGFGIALLKQLNIPGSVEIIVNR